MSLRTTLSAGLFTLIAALALAGTASASTLTSPEGTTYTGEIVATSVEIELDGAFVTIKCNHSEVKGNIEQHGAGVNAGGKVSYFDLTECNFITVVKLPGTLHVTSSNEVISSGAEISINTSVGTCILTTTNTVVGTLAEGKNATWNMNSAKIPRTGGNFLCGSSVTWTGSYDFVTPNDIWVD